jgi:signal transduction histidine kinase
MPLRHEQLAACRSRFVGGIDARTKRPNSQDVADPIANAVFGLLFDSSTEAIFIVDRSTRRIVSANVRVSDLLSRDVDAVIGATIEDLSYESGRDLSAPGHYEDVALTRGDDYPIYVTLNIIHVEEPTYGSLAAYMARDTSERRLLEHELVAKHSALFAAYADLERAYAQLHETKQELETRNREIAALSFRAAVGELVAGIAHHLNNPVGALTSTIRRMSNQVAKLPAEHRGELERLSGRVAEISSRIESNVGAIVNASRSAESHAPVELPPDLQKIASAFTNRLDDTTKDPS